MAILMENSMMKLMLEREAVFMEREVVSGLSDPVLIQKARMSGRLMRLMAEWVEQRHQAMQENEAMKQALIKIVDVLQDEKSLSRNRVRNALVRACSAKLKKTAGADPGIENRDLRAALCEGIEGLDALEGLLPEDAASLLKSEIHSALRLQLDHGLASIQRPPA